MSTQIQVSPKSASGIFGISDSSGVYTYYATLTLAMAAATSGQTIEVFADVIETGAVTINLKDGVTINGNGHTYKSSYSATSIYMFTILTSATVSISNLRIEKTAGNYYVFYHSTSGTIFFNNTFLVSNQASAVIFSDTALGTIDSGVILNTSATGSGIFINYNARCINVKSIVSGSGSGFYTDNYPAYFYNCYGQSNSGAGIVTITSTLVNCIGVSVSSFGIRQGSSIAVTRNCNGLSTSGTGMQCSGPTFNSTGTSVSGTGFHSEGGTETINCSGISSSGSGLTNFYAGLNLINCTAISSTNYGAYLDTSYAEPRTRVQNCYFWSKWDNAGGHAYYIGASVYPTVVSGTTLRCTNASAKNIASPSTISFKIFKNIYVGGSGLSVGITNSMVNIEDVYGNITQ